MQNGEYFSSTIDHFAGNATLLNCVTETGVIHSGENPSNHSPIYAKIQLGGIDFSSESVKNEKRVNWEKSSLEARENYLTTLSNKLDKLVTPDCVNCRDVTCTVHMDQFEDYTMSLMAAMEEAAQECLHSTGGGKAENGGLKLIPGWAEYVKPYSEESKFWCATWQSAGMPRNGALHDAMKYSKCQYKYAVRRLKRANEKIQNDKFVLGLLSGGANIFSEIKKHRGNVKNVSSRIDDQVGGKNIANKFADIYAQLYNQHEHGEELAHLDNNISEAIGAHSMEDADRVTVDLVKKALNRMKSGKKDALFDLHSDCLLLI